ncbi:MAG: aldose 1-epimerase family protein [Alphaproteobacteria bacterium]|nr:aldose 1-epimerase family protein [Alphaproteobacteria bacterium]
MSDALNISSSATTATFARRGAELLSLRHRDREFICKPDPALWNWGHSAPLLFPVVGRSRDDQVKVDGNAYPMPLHGFALSRDFRIVAAEPARIEFELVDDDTTRAMFPFAFRLTVVATIGDGRLDFTATIENTGARTAPFAFGYHPAFHWAQTPEERQTYICKFECRESGEIRRGIKGVGLLRSDKYPLPLDDRILRLRDDVFGDGALQFEQVRSRRVWFGRPGDKGIEVRFPDSPQLGIWTRAGAPFLCIEPWQGLAEFENGSGELAERPCPRFIAAGDRVAYRMAIELDAEAIP